jgi:hypothetical protein
MNPFVSTSSRTIIAVGLLSLKMDEIIDSVAQSALTMVEGFYAALMKKQEVECVIPA